MSILYILKKMGLGLKVKNTLDRFGRKSNNTINRIGKKSNQIINTLDNAADKVLDKSGVVTDTLRIGANVGNKIVSEINKSGFKDIPVVGKLTTAIESGTSQLSRGATKLDQVRDRLKERKDDLAMNARQNVNDSRERALQFI
jgi:hypothetical protein